MDILHFSLYFIIGSCLILYLSLRKKYSYWAERGILQDEPKFFFGNMRELGTKAAFQIFRKYYIKYKNKAKYVGFYFFFRRSMFLIDLELIKNVFIKDFEYFTSRGMYYNEEDDPLSANVVFLMGEKWRKSRGELSPCFTSSKLKNMFSAAVDVSKQLVEVIEEQQLSHPHEDIEIKSLVHRYIVDITGSIGFGLNCNSLKNPEAEFKKMVLKSFQHRHHWVISSLMCVYPNLARKLGMTYYTDDVIKFYVRIVNETVKYREQTGIQRNDILDVLIELRNSEKRDRLSMHQVAAHAFTLLTGGVETNTTSMSFCLYDLALHQDVQDKARAEINEVLKKYDGEFTYEGMNDMIYLQQVFFETMRMRSVFPCTTRVCVKDYVIPNTDHVIEKDTLVIFPIDAIHHDPDIYPNPEEFVPERFSVEEVKKRHPMTSLAFGGGPRMCIGKRFGIMQIMIGLAMLLRNYRILPTSNTSIPLQYSTKKIFTEAKCDIYVKLEKI